MYAYCIFIVLNILRNAATCVQYLKFEDQRKEKQGVSVADFNQF